MSKAEQASGPPGFGRSAEGVEASPSVRRPQRMSVSPGRLPLISSNSALVSVTEQLPPSLLLCSFHPRRSRLFLIPCSQAVVTGFNLLINATKTLKLPVMSSKPCGTVENNSSLLIIKPSEQTVGSVLIDTLPKQLLETVCPLLSEHWGKLTLNTCQARQ